MPVLIRVLSVPSRHVYVDHLADPDGDEVTRLPDPLVPGRSQAAPWWPPLALEAQWVLDHADEFDVIHVHFGFDAARPQDLRDVVAALRRHGKPLVYTVHDLRNPHHDDAPTPTTPSSASSSPAADAAHHADPRRRRRDRGALGSASHRPAAPARRRRSRGCRGRGPTATAFVIGRAR